MTHPLRALPLALAALLVALPGTAPRGLAESLPPGVVAVVGREQPLTLTFDGLCVAAVQHAEADLRRLQGGPRNILEQLIEEEMAAQECERLGLVVTKEDVQATWEQWDTKVRRISLGDRTLPDMIRRDGQTEQGFREKIRHQLQKEAIAQHPQYLGRSLPKDDENTRLQQIGIVIGTLRKKTDVRYGVWTVDHLEGGTRPDGLPKDHVATVNGVPITAMQFGRALLLRLPEDKVRDYLENECKTALITQDGVRLSDADLAAEIEYLRELWELERELLREEVWRTVTFKDRFSTYYGVALDDVMGSRYNRGLLGLVRRERAQVRDEEIVKTFEEQREGQYGSHIVVTDIVIGFAQKKSLVGDAGVRTLVRAREIAREILRKHGTGVPFEKIVADVNNARDATLRAQRIRLYNTDADRILHGQAGRMRDGDVSSPFETLSEVHVLRREGLRPARPLPEVRTYVRERVARQRAAAWLKERIGDPTWVRMEWPLRERTDPPR